jgi:hypothetical protein
MADNDQDVTQEQPAVQAAPQLPAHLNPQWFADGASIPAFMAGNSNWMNISGSVDEVVHVRMPDGQYQKTTSPIHLGVWLLLQHAQIIPEPKES